MDIINIVTDKFPGALKQVFDYNRWKTALILGFASFSGCMLLDTKTDSVIFEGKKVNRTQLQSELQTTLVRFEQATQDLDAKDARKQQIISLLESLATSSALPLGPIAGTGIGLLLGAFGGSLDKRKADRQIETLKSQPMMVIKDPGPIEVPVNSTEAVAKAK